MERLYKKDSVGKILQWEGSIKQVLEGVELITSYGELNGTITSTSTTITKGKNENKSNATTPLTQAESQLQSLYKRKRRQGYKSLEDLKYVDNSAFGGTSIDIETFLKINLSFDTTDLNGVLKPMKAQQYYRSKKDWKDKTGKVWDDRKYFYLLNPFERKLPTDIIIKFPCLAQPKLNGVRALVWLDDNDMVHITSKDGLEYNVYHIIDEFSKHKEIFNYNGDKIIFDGELYIHNEKLQVITSAVKSQNLNSSRVEFVCFDLAIAGYTNLERIKLYKELLSCFTESLNSSIRYVKTIRVNNDELVQLFTDKCIEEGYEGAILRSETAYYGFGKRPTTMVKLKRVIDEEFRIIDIVPQEKNPELGLYVCRTNTGEEFKVTPRGTEEEKQLLLFQKHLYINKLLTCTFYEYTERGVPFHVVDNIIRDYE